MKKPKVKKETIYRCPFCSKKPTVSQPIMTGETWKAFCSQKTHAVYVYGTTRNEAIKRWNKGR